MARKKKTRRITDIMPIRKADKKIDITKARSGKKLTRYELDAKAREDKKKRKHKGLASGKQVKKQDPMKELENLENNEILNELLDALDAGKTISKSDQQFVDECLDRISELMEELGIEDEDESEDDLYRTFERMDINQFR